MKSFIYFSTLLILFFLIPNKTDLRGHWHVHPLTNNVFGDVSFEVMEIFNNGTATFGTEYKVGGKINTWLKTLKFGGECLALNFDYKFDGKNLLLNRKEYDGKYLAVKCDENCCNKQEEFFAYQKKVEIDLPIALSRTNLVPQKSPSSLEQRLLYGFSKKKYLLNCFGPRSVLVLDNLIASEEDIPLWDIKQKVKIQKGLHSKIRVVIYAHQETEVSRILLALEKYKAIGYKKVFFALRSPTVYQDFKIWLKPFDLSYLKKMIQSKGFNTIEGWLSSN